MLTGPNAGGKTTFLQAVGLVQILAQIGLYVPARLAEVSICDNVYTHYPALEDPLKGTGRFGEEAERLRCLFGEISEYSLVLLNESLSSTSVSEATYLAQDMLAVLSAMGTRAVYATHLHQLAIDRHLILDCPPEECPIESLVAQIRRYDDGSMRPTFSVAVGPPTGKSYADALAEKHGVSRGQLESLVDARRTREPRTAAASNAR